MATLTPINTNTILHTADPKPSVNINVPGWVITEKMEITFGEATGRADTEHTQFKGEMLAYFFEQGWFVDAVISAKSAGHWERVSERDSTGASSRSGSKTSSSSRSSTSTSTETGYSTSSGSGSESSTSNSNSTDSSTSFSSNSYSSNYNSNAGDNGNSSGSASGSSNVNANGNDCVNASGSGSSTSSNSASANKTTSGTNSSTDSGSISDSSTESDTTSSSGIDTEIQEYWSSWVKVRLLRKRISPEKVLATMVGELATAYNAGEKIVSERYSAIIGLYSTMLSRTENEVGKLGNEVSSFKSLMNGVMTSIKSAMSSLSIADNASEVNKAAEYQRKTINEKFDSLIASKKGELITAGLYNSTQWVMVEAGLERERGVALLAVSDKKLGWKRDFAAALGSLSGPLEEAARAIWDAGKEGVLRPTDVRNGVLKWMCDYAAQHQTARPKVEDMAQLPKILDGMAGGYAVKG